ncbi:cell envelope-related transcriptional attenuator [Stanieria sp. NIES-3757]|nr:cell envelope-related transcriptional attenuator [Stanieria sp. NIES-3757]
MLKHLKYSFHQKNQINLNFKKNQKLSSFRKGLSWGIIVSLATIISGIIGASLTSITPINQAIIAILEQTKTPNLSSKQSGAKLAPNSLAQPVNILFIGIEPVKTVSDNYAPTFTGKSKTILLLEFKPQQKSLQVITIPGDSQVEIPGIGTTNIINANRYGGAKFLTQVVRDNFADLGVSPNQPLTIDGYLRVSDLALQQLNDWFSTEKDFAQAILNKKRQAPELNSGVSLNQLEQQTQSHQDTISNWQTQKIFLQQLHQYWYSPELADSIPEIIDSLKPYIDTNLTTPEILALANFIHQLEPERIKITIVPQYIKHQPKITDQPVKILGNHNLAQISSAQAHHRLKNLPIAVQNTTDNPELASRLLDFLKQRNFRNVYLIDHLPIDLNQTEIIVERGNIALADYLKKSLGLGRLELSPTSDSNFELTIRIGEDAQYLNLEDGFIRY